MRTDVEHTILEPGRLFDRDYRAAGGNFLVDYQSLWQQYSSSEFRFRDHKPWQLLSKPLSQHLVAGERQTFGARHRLELPRLDPHDVGMEPPVALVERIRLLHRSLVQQR